MAKTSLPIRKKVFAMKIDAGHDTYGNPRRGWMLYDAGGYYLGFVDEGYTGRSALKKVAPQAVELGSVPTTAGTYRDLNKDDLGLRLIRQGSKKGKGRSRKNPGKAKSRAKGRSKARSKAKSKAKSEAKKARRVRTTGGYRYMVGGKFVKKAVYDRAVGKSSKTKSRKTKSKAKSRKAKPRATSRKTKRVATSRGYRYMVDGKFASKEAYDRAMGKKARKAKSKAKRAKSRAKSRAKGRSKVRKGRSRR